MEQLYLWIVLAPLFGALMAGLLGKQIGRAGSHTVTILGVAFSAVASMYVLYQMLNGAPVYNESVYTWAVINDLTLEVGFLVDKLTAMMMVVTRMRMATMAASAPVITMSTWIRKTIAPITSRPGRRLPSSSYPKTSSPANTNCVSACVHLTITPSAWRRG